MHAVKIMVPKNRVNYKRRKGLLGLAIGPKKPVIFFGVLLDAYNFPL